MNLDHFRAIEQARLVHHDREQVEAIGLVEGLFGVSFAEAGVAVEAFLAHHDISFRGLYELVSAGEVRLRPLDMKRGCLTFGIAAR